MSEKIRFQLPDKNVFDGERFGIPVINSIYPEVVASGPPRLHPEDWQYDRYGRIVDSHNFVLKMPTSIRLREMTISGTAMLNIGQQGGAIEQYDVNGVTVISPGPRARPTADDEARNRGFFTYPNMSYDGVHQRGEYPYQFHGFLDRCLMFPEHDHSDLVNGKIVLSLRHDEVPLQYVKHGYVPENSVIFLTHQLDSEGGVVSTLQINNLGRESFHIWPGVHIGWTIPESSKNSLEDLGVNWLSPSQQSIQALNQTITTDLDDGVHWVNEEQHIGAIAQLGEGSGGVSTQILPLKGFGQRSQVWAWADSEDTFYHELASRGSASDAKSNKILVPAGGHYIFAWRVSAFTNPMVDSSRIT